MGQPTPEVATPVAAEAERPAEVNTPAAPAEKLYAGKYKSVEDLEAGYKEVETHIASTGKKANLIDSLVVRIAQEQGISEGTAFDYIASLSNGELANLAKETPTDTPLTPPTQSSDPVARAEARRARWDILSSRLLSKHPEASNVIDSMEIEFMQKGDDPIAAFEKRYLPMIEAGKEAAMVSAQKKNAASVTTGAGIVPAPDPLAEAFLYAQKTNDWKPYIRLKTANKE